MQDYLHICIVLDASGSMASIQEDIKGTVNNFMLAQQKFPGKTLFDIYQFSSITSRIVDKADAKLYKADFMDDYVCTGSTALYDAVCTAIDTLGMELAAMPESERPDNVLVAIVTDGEENASKKFTLKDVKERIDRQTNQYNWVFAYLAANQDAFAVGARMGFVAESTCAFVDNMELSVKGCASLSFESEKIRARPKRQQ